MPEIDDVLTGEVIASEWGNDIRDRTVQRYASAAARGTEHATPAAGDLSYLADTDFVYYYNGSAWVKLVAAPLVTADITDAAVTHAKLAASVAQNLVAIGGDQDTTAGALTSSFVDKASTVFTKPASWATYRITATGFAFLTAAAGSVEARVEIGGSNGAAVAPSGSVCPVCCFHEVDTSTSPVTVALAARESAGAGAYEFSTIEYKAVRLT